MNTLILVCLVSIGICWEECDSGEFYVNGGEDLCMEGCAFCETATACIECSAGYALTEDDMCEECGIPGCAACVEETIDTVCTSCFSEYVLYSTEACLSCTMAIGDSTGWDENAASCIADSATNVVVQNCEDYYGRWEDDSGVFHCEACPENAASCSFNTGTKPSLAKFGCDEYYTADVTDSVCLSCTEATNGDPEASLCTCDVTGEVVVEACDTGFGVVVDVKPPVCQSCGEGADNCVFVSSTQSKTVCSDGYVSNSGDITECLSCTETSIGGDLHATACESSLPGEVSITECEVHYDPVIGKPAFCQECIDDNAIACEYESTTEVSTTCADGYTNDDSIPTVCLSCKETSTDTGGDPNAATCNTGEGPGNVVVTGCEEGYGFWSEDASCVDCSTEDPNASDCVILTGGEVERATNCVAGWVFDEGTEHCYQCGSLPDPDPEDTTDGGVDLRMTLCMMFFVVSLFFLF